MAVHIDLRPDRSLLNSKFESYRLSLDSFPILKKEFSSGVEHVDLGEEHFGFLHAHLSSLVNHLFYDFWSQGCVFFADKSRYLQWGSLSAVGHLSELRVVWQLPQQAGIVCKGNTSISFAAQEWAVVCDGDQTLFLLNTPSRGEGEPWQLCHTEKLDHVLAPCAVMYSLHQLFPSSQQVDCIVAYICKWQDLPEQNIHGKEENRPRNDDSFVCVLEWITFSCSLGTDMNEWHVKRSRRLVGSAVPVYSCLESGSSCISLVSEKEFVFLYDSLKQSCTNPLENGEKDVKAAELPPLYTYMQSMEDVTVVFKAPDSLSKSSVSVHMAPKSIEVTVDGKSVLGGPLGGVIDVTASTWLLEGNKLELTLSKSKEGEMWSELVPGDKRGEEIHDPSLIEEIHNRLAHLTSDKEAVDENKPAYNPQEMEECDFAMDILTFQRLDGDTHQVTHQSNMGGHQLLFSQAVSTEDLPVFCLRHDIDGIVWQPENTSSEGEPHQIFKITHVATYPALGYVLASKQDRKFIVSSPDFSFVAVCDGKRHVYIYRQPEALNSALELRNRKTGQDVNKIAKQHVINLEDSDTILGLQASKECIFVLSSKALFGIKV